MGRGACLQGSATPEPQGDRASALPILGSHSIYAYTVRRSTAKFDTVTDGEGGLCSGTSHVQRITWSAVAPALPNVWGSLRSAPCNAECPRFARGTLAGRVSWGQPRLPSQVSGVPALLNFGVLYLCPTLFNAERPNSAW